jgi:hypothetical protein
MDHKRPGVLRKSGELGKMQPQIHGKRRDGTGREGKRGGDRDSLSFSALALRSAT